MRLIRATLLKPLQFVAMFAFAVAMLVASPVILLNLGVSWVADRIRRRWPESARAQQLGYWLPFATVIGLNLVLAALLVFLIARAAR